MQDEWQRLDAVVTVLTTATNWQMVCDTLQVILSPEATVYRLSHRGRKLTTSQPGGGFWVSHEPKLRQAMIDQVPVHVTAGPVAGWWVPWSSGALHLSADLALPPRWLLTVAHLLSQFQRLPAAGTARGEDVKALRQLNELSWIIHGTPDLAALLHDLPGHLSRHLGLSHCALMRLDPASGQGAIVGAWELGVGRPEWADLAFERHSPLGEVLWEAPVGRWRHDPADREWHSARADALLSHGDALIAPLVAFGERWGLLVVRHPRPRSQRLGRMLAATADHVAIALAIRTHGEAVERRRRQAEASFRSAPTPLALLDGEGSIVEPNAAAKALLGDDDTSHAPFYQLLAAPDRQRVRDAWLDLESGRTVKLSQVEMLAPAAGGALRQMACHLAPLPDQPRLNAVARAILSLCDHSDLIREIRDLEASVGLWESLAAALPIRVALVDVHHRVVWASPAGDGEQRTGSCCHALFQDVDGGTCMALQALQQGMTRRLPASSGGEAVLVWPVPGAEGRILGAVAMSGGVHASWNVDTATWAVLGQLLDAVRHDLHSPLGVISGRAEALRLDGVDSPHVEAIDRAVDRQVAMLRTLATWRPQGAAPAPTDLVEVAQATLAGLQGMARSVALGWDVVATDAPLLTMAAVTHLQGFLTAVFLLPGRVRGGRQLRLVCHGEPAWLHLAVDAEAPLPPLGAEGRDLLTALGGEVVVTPTPGWRLPRWPG